MEKNKALEIASRIIPEKVDFAAGYTRDNVVYNSTRSICLNNLTIALMSGTLVVPATVAEVETEIELALSRADKLPKEKHKNVLGDKWRYIRAIAQALTGRIGQGIVAKIDQILKDNLKIEFSEVEPHSWVEGQEKVKEEISKLL